MARKKVIVKRIQAIQNLGAMDVLCTDKTHADDGPQRDRRAATATLSLRKTTAFLRI